MTAELVVLGSGSILPRAGHGCAGYALCPEPGGPVTLFDCGPGTIRALGGASIALERVRRVVLSHFHPDHCLDVFALLFARRNPAFAHAPPLELVGPVGTSEVLAGGRAAFGRWVEDERMELCEVRLDGTGRAVLQREGVQLSCVATAHSREALAWRADLSNGPARASFAYTGDTPPNPSVAALARGVDLFLVECSFPDEAAVKNHLSPTSAGELAAEARCRRLVLTHFYPETDPAAAARIAARVYSGPIETAHDGSRHSFGPADSARPPA